MVTVTATFFFGEEDLEEVGLDVESATLTPSPLPTPCTRRARRCPSPSCTSQVPWALMKNGQVWAAGPPVEVPEVGEEEEGNESGEPLGGGVLPSSAEAAAVEEGLDLGVFRRPPGEPPPQT